MRQGLKTAAVLVLALILGGEAWSRYQSAVEDRQSAIDLARQQAATLESRRVTLQAEQASLHALNADAPALWLSEQDGAPPYTANQDALVNLTAETGVHLMSFQPLEDQKIGPINALRYMLEVEADLAGWQIVMDRIHAHEPLILLVSSELRRLNRTDEETGQPLALLRIVVDLPYQPEKAL
ncbi:MAG: hypothetical protein AAFV38_08150 [Pseudomonadota bacterium]